MKKAHVVLFVLILSVMLVAVPASAQKSSTEAECVGGQATSPVRIDVFSDFQCPACQSFFIDTVRQVLATYARQNKVCVVYHEMPLPMHQYSRPAARYAVAARRVGREQWIRVAGHLFSLQSSWSTSGDVEGTVAKALSPENFAKVKEHLKDPAIDALIDRDLALAQRKGVRSTPTYFITVQGKEQKIVGATQYDILKRYLDSILPR